MPATLHASISKIRTVSSGRESVAVPLSRPEQAESFSTSDVSEQSTIAVQNLNGDGGNTQAWSITVAAVMFG